MPWARQWNGLTIMDRAHRAAGRGIIGIGMAVGVETKILTHKLSGTLARSVHVAPARYELGETDEKLAEAGHDLALSVRTMHATPTPEGPAVEVGSWVSYACVEWVGRGHPGVTEGLEAVRGPRANKIMQQAFFEEHL